MASLLWNRLQDKRGQIRGIDFAISAFFFVVVLGQLVVVILNANILIITQKETETSRDDIDSLAAKMFGSEGSPANWGDLNSDQPDSFGLAVQELASTGFELDPRKLARLNEEVARITGYSGVAVGYETIHELLGLETNIQFHLTIWSPLSIELTPGDHVVSVTTSLLDKEKLEDVNLSLFAVNLNNGILVPLAVNTTTATGEGTLDYSSFSPLDFPHALIIVGQKGPMWGINHYFPPLEDGNQIINFAASTHPLFLTQNDAYSGQVIALSDFLRSTENHTVSFIYTNASAPSTFSYTTPGANDHTTGPFLQTLFDGSVVGVVIGLVCIRDINGVFGYRVGTLPALLDKSEGVDGIFSQIGPTIPETETKGIGSNLYFLTVRGTLLVAQLTVWEEL
jgi:hypothetical protein